MQDGIGELGGRTVGLIGFGAIPRSWRRSWRRWAATVIYTPGPGWPMRIAAVRPLEPLLEEADIVSLHLPLAPETRQHH